MTQLLKYVFLGGSMGSGVHFHPKLWFPPLPTGVKNLEIRWKKRGGIWLVFSVFSCWWRYPPEDLSCGLGRLQTHPGPYFCMFCADLMLVEPSRRHAKRYMVFWAWSMTPNSTRKSPPSAPPNTPIRALVGCPGLSRLGFHR